MVENRNIDTSKNPEPTATDSPRSLIAEARVVHIPLEKLDMDDVTFVFRAALRVGPLKKSIEVEGQQLPIVVRKKGRTRGMRYQIISGFRRATAMKELGLPTIAAIVRQDLDDDEAAFRAAVVENEQRKTYSDIDRALVIHRHQKMGYSSVEVAELMGLSKRQKNNLLGLLRLPDVVKEAIDDPDGYFGATHGITLRQLSNTYADLEVGKWVAAVNDGHLSVAQLKRAVNKAHRVVGPVPLGSIFNDASTRREAGVYRLQPLKLVVGELTDEDKERLKAELEELMKALE